MIIRTVCLAILLMPVATFQAERDFQAAIKKFGDRTYRVFEKGKPVGMATLKSRIVEGEGGVALAVFEDRIDKTGDSPLTVEYVEWATLNGLRLRLATRVDGGPKEDDPKIVVKGRDAHVTSDRGNADLEKVEGARGERSLIRLMCMAPQKVGATIQADLLVVEPVDYQRKHEVRCTAEETIDIGGKKVAAFKWVDKREGKSLLSDDPTPYKIDNAYWIGADGVLLKFTSGPLEMVLESK